MVLAFKFILLSLIFFDCTFSFQEIIPAETFPFCYTGSFCRENCICGSYRDCNPLPIDNEYRRMILYYHNQMRDGIGAGEPQARAMTILEYDMDLEQISICWASKCINEFSSCFFTPRYTSTSQSVIQINLEEGKIPNLEMWMEELIISIREMTLMDTPSISNNLAQIFSDKILAMGCAWSLSSNNQITFVCTYGPSGSTPDGDIYQTGQSCSSCPKGYGCDFMEPFPNLCKPERMELESLQDNAYTISSPIEIRTPPRMPLHPEAPVPASPQYSPTLSPKTSTATPQFQETTGADATDPKKRAGNDEDGAERKEKHRDWLILGVMLALLILALICAITAVCIYTYGFSCR